MAVIKRGTMGAATTMHHFQNEQFSLSCLDHHAITDNWSPLELLHPV